MVILNRISLFGLLVFLSSCAQVGVINGGGKDLLAPKPIENGIQPPSETCLFSTQKITFQFNEFIKLNNPLDNITILPSGPKINATVTKKKLTLELVGELSPNTTYLITFNNAVQDFNEGNDSLMHYVFSTGNFIDSLEYSGKVSDMYTGEKLQHIVVGLYNENDSIQTRKPLYFSKTNSIGEFKIPYIKSGKYAVYAFEDLNKDLKFQINEKVGFRTELLELNESRQDSSTITLFPTILPPKITEKAFHYPARVKLKANFNLENATFLSNQKTLNPTNLTFYRGDSISLLLPQKVEQDIEILVRHEQFSDTLRFRVPAKAPLVTYEAFPSSGAISQTKQLTFVFSDEIVRIDTNSIKVMDIDSIQIFPTIDFSENELSLNFNNQFKSGTIQIDPKALELRAGIPTEKIVFPFLLKPRNEFGSLIVKNENISDEVLIELIKKGKVIRTVSAQSLKDNPLLEFIEPGEYSFRMILDENKNGRWDYGNVTTKKQAEQVFHFPESVIIRANWETEVELSLSDTNEVVK